MEQIKKYIYQIYKDKSFSAAAKSLYISQPALSAAISRFEKELGVKIFDRTKQPISLTTQGAIYVNAIEEIMHIEESVEERFRNLSDMNYGFLTVGGSAYAAYAIMSAACARFYQRYPKIKVTLNLGNRGDSNFLNASLTNGELDLLLTYHNEDSRYLYEEIAKDKLLIAINKNHPIPENLKKYAFTSEELLTANIDESKKIEDLSLFKSLPFIPYQDSIHISMMNKMFDHYKTVPYNIQFAKHSGVHYSLMAAGVGALIFPSIPILCSPHIDKDVLYFVPKSDEFCHTLYVARTHSTDKNPIVHAYIQAAKDVYNALPKL